MNAGETVTLRNCKVVMHNGHMRLMIDKWGAIKPTTEKLSAAVDTSKNFHETEYELVPN
jgi:hypothetical protein